MQTSVEISELLNGLVEAFDHVVVPIVLSKDGSLRARLILRMKRKFILRAAQRSVQSCVCTTTESIVDVMLNEALRFGMTIE